MKAVAGHRDKASIHGDCLLGGAAGDALGAALEFLSVDDIRARFGEARIAGLVGQ